MVSYCRQCPTIISIPPRKSPFMSSWPLFYFNFKRKRYVGLKWNKSYILSFINILLNYILSSSDFKLLDLNCISVKLDKHVQARSAFKL